MLIAFDVKSKMKRHISATVHVDNTCRVQTVTKIQILNFIYLIKCIKKLKFQYAEHFV